MAKKTLIGFQQRSVEGGLERFIAARDLLNAAGADEAGRALAIAHNGHLLIEAPTGSGKTLIAGTLIERFSAVEDVVWFWFAPFKGVVGQTAAFLREEFHGLRLRELADDRSAESSRRGDVFVTTWQTVATRVTDKRNVRREGEMNPSIDGLVSRLRAQGLRIGVVVDEAHHGFGEKTLAAKFFKEVLNPEYAVLITATPDDKEILAFEKALGIPELQRNRVSRIDAVEAGLIKRGVKCAAYFADPNKTGLVDLEGTALRDGVAAHRRIKRMLADLGVPLTPLLLVQADSTAKSVEAIRERLLKMGFTPEQVAVHTAEEPDAGLLALANDDHREVLVFKMAVALGFDAPRAFTLVSMRASRDPDFGVQLVGRILRTHRLLHARARTRSLPDELAYGYVFLASPETQSGLDIAGQKINSIQTEYAKASSATVVLRFGDGSPVIRHVAEGGQVEMFSLEAQTTGGVMLTDGDSAVSPSAEPLDFNFGIFFGVGNEDGSTPAKRQQAAGPSGEHRYELKSGVPRRFKTQVVCADPEVTEEACANQFIVTTRDLFEAVKNRVPVTKRTLDVFTHEIQQEFNFSAELSADEAARRATATLSRNRDVFDPRELRRALLKKLQRVMAEEAMAEADDPEQVARFLDVILSSHPEALWEAQKKALAAHAEIQETEDLPAEIVSSEPLTASPRNAYGVLPPGINGWEREFAEMLDRDPHNLVLWWHRNPPDKPWAVNVLMPDGRGFYPDFVIGIDGRQTEDHALLADPKERFETRREAPKVLAEHRDYGRVLIVAKDSGRWMTIGYDERSSKAIPAGEFRLADTPGYGIPSPPSGLAPGRDSVSRKEKQMIVVSIEKTAGVCGGDACIGRTRIPVWTLEQSRRLGFSNADLLAAFPGIQEADLEAAWAYVAGHREEIERAVAENDNA